MRKQINEINNELNNVQVRENILKNQVQNQDALIEKLEKDLLSGKGWKGQFWGLQPKRVFRLCENNDFVSLFSSCHVQFNTARKLFGILSD